MSELVERLRRKGMGAAWSCDGETYHDPSAELHDEAADRIEQLEIALGDCVKRLRRCAENAGNAPFAVDALCEQFESALRSRQSTQEQS